MNTLTNYSGLPPFEQIDPNQIEAQLTELLATNRAQLKQLLATNTTYTWQNLLLPLEELSDRLHRFWSPIHHLHSVANTPDLRQAYESCLPILSDYGTELSQHEDLYRAVAQIAATPEFASSPAGQKKVVANMLRDFKLAGVHLTADKKAHYKLLQQRFSQLTNQFETHVLDATAGWSKLITEPTQLAGIPESAQNAAREAAERKQQQGFLFTLEFPSYFAVITYADDRTLRKEFYEAYVTRASDVGPNAKQFDNSQLMADIVNLRQEIAQLLGYSNYADYALTTRMAKTSAEVLDFLHQLATQAKPYAQTELQALKNFAAEFGVSDLQAFDMAYFSEKLQNNLFNITQEMLRPYFPEQTVLSGLFAIVGKLYQLKISERFDVVTWHPDVRFFEVFDATNTLRGQFYLDLYARSQKRGGAWMDDAITRRKCQNSHIQIPVAYLTCNLTPPTKETPALFTHDEVQTLFHEFGHGLHHMLTLIDEADISGINGVAWDAVELPSQLMEYWCWEPEGLALVAAHYQTKESLPAEWLVQLKASRTFQAGMQMLRQIEFSLFDFQMHQQPNPTTTNQIAALLAQIREKIAVMIPPPINRFQHSFTHIFAGGYAAGYYSYKWAEVLASDAFAAFETEGIFNPQTGARFLHAFLEKGGLEDALDLFVAFRGRKPNVAALLRHYGLEETDCSL